ncbi:MAG: peptidylprolyl isomerase [Candidatus Scalindua sp.]|jgi:foldase protein PrsA|nr:peptidylprolyl isomerase [Candidatus Scalindua sp.]MDV5167198.1 peptidylprolyl isomerase [Candidatus Scalindua sp.]
MKNIAFIFGTVLITLGMISSNVTFGADVKLDSEVVAVVNGEEISRDTLANVLININGAEGLERIIRRTLVKQEAKKRNLTISEEEIAERVALHINVQIQSQMKKGGLKDEQDLKRELEKAGMTMEQYRTNIGKMFKLTDGQIEAELLAEKIIRETVNITNEELHEAFEEQLGEKILARQIVFRTIRDAENTLERLKSGANFESLAKKESIDRNSASRGGRMRPFGPEGVMGKAVANLKNGELSDIVKTDSGYHIIKLEKRIPRSTKKFSEVKEDLEKFITVQKVQNRLNPWLLNLAESADITRNLPE